MKSNFAKISKATFFFGVAFFCLTPESFSKELVQRRKKRIEAADGEWSAPKVSINIHLRVPIYDALGYLAATYEDSAKLTQLLTEMRPTIDKVKRLSGGSLKGRSFPSELGEELNQDRHNMFAAVQSIYGTPALTDLKSYLSKKRQGVSKSLFGVLE